MATKRRLPPTASERAQRLIVVKKKTKGPDLYSRVWIGNVNAVTRGEHERAVEACESIRGFVASEIRAAEAEALKLAASVADAYAAENDSLLGGPYQTAARHIARRIREHLEKMR